MKGRLKLGLIALLILIVGGVFVFTNQTDNVSALSNGADAVDVFGQFYDGSVDYFGNLTDGGATEVSLDSPSDVVIDETNHKMYVADYNHKRVLIYELSDLNVLEDLSADYVLGNDDLRGWSYNTPPSSTDISFPQGLAVDEVNNVLFVSDSMWNRVLVYDFGSGAPISDGRAADYVLGQTDFVSDASGTSSSTFDSPMGLEYDSTNDRLYVADSSNNRVMVFDGTAISTGMSATWALGSVTDFNSVGGTSCNPYALSTPQDIARDPSSGLIYVVDSDHNRVAVYDFSQPGDRSLSVPGTTVNGIEIFYVLGQGATTFCWTGGYPLILDPQSVTVDASSKVYVGGSSTGYTHVYDMTTFSPFIPAVSTFVEEPVYDYIQYDSVSGMDYNSTEDYLYFVESVNHRGLIYDASIFDGSFGVTNTAGAGFRENGFGRVDPSGDFSEQSSNYSNNGPNDVGFNTVTGVLYDEDENWLFVSDEVYGRIKVYDRDNSGAMKYHAEYVIGQSNQFSHDTYGFIPSSQNLSDPQGMAVGTIGSTKYLFVADYGYNRVLAYDLSDGLTNVDEPAAYVLGQADFTSDAVATTQSGLSAPLDVAFDEVNDILWIADSGNFRVVGHDFGVSGIADNRLADYVLGQDDFVTGTQTESADAVSFFMVMSVEVDDSNDRLFVGENNRVLSFDVSGTVTNGMSADNVLGVSDLTSVAAYGPGDSTFNLAVAGLSYDTDKLYVADSAQNRVLVFNVASISNGESADYVLGQSDFSGTSSDVTQSALKTPTALTFSNEDSHLYVADQGNSRVMVFSATFGPEAPSSCEVDTYTNNSVTLIWSDNSSDEDNFVIEKSTDNSNWTTGATVNSNVTTGDVESLIPGTLYYFRIKAVNAIGDSDVAACGSQTLPANNAPDDLTVDTPTESQEDVPLTGQEFLFVSGDTDEDVFYYRFELSTSEDFLTTLKYWDQRDSAKGWPTSFYEGSAVDYTTFTLPEDYVLTHNTDYYWRARAFDVHGAASAYSDVRSFTTIESAEEEESDVPFVSYFNGGTYAGSTTMSFSKSTGKALLPSTNSFASGIAAFGSGQTYEMQLFDADSDGDLDVVVGRAPGPDNGDIYLNDGDGGFTFGQTIYGADAYGIADFDYDGDLDIASPDYININDGTGTFVAEEYGTGGGGSVEIGDLNGDGFVDLFVTNWGGENTVYLNDGDADFTETSTNMGENGTSANSAALADYDGDGDVDVVVMNNGGDGYHDSTLYINEGGMEFTSNFLLYTGNTMHKTFAVDIDNDGDQDLLISAHGIYLNDGEANFTESDESFGGYSSGCDVTFNHADVDGDGDQDVLCASSNDYDGSDGQNYLFRNKGDGTFFNEEELGTTGKNTGVLAAGDVDGDGDVDIIEGNGGVGWNQTEEQNYLYLNTGANDLVEQVLVGEAVTAVFDADSDSDMDLWFGAGTGRMIRINNGDGTYEEEIVQAYDGDSFDATSYDTEIVDVDGDGDLDIVEATRTEEDEPNLLWLNDGDAGFTLSTNAFGTNAAHYKAVEVGDVDGDGDPDVLFAGGESMSNIEPELWLNDGSGDFSKVTEPFGAIGAVEIWDFDLGDIDGDGDLDVVLRDVLFLNDGDGNFSESDEDIPDTIRIQLGDMDNDGDLDLITGDSEIYLNQNGEFSTDALELNQSSDFVGDMDIVDLDSDGDLDIVMAIEGDTGAYNAIYRNYGNLSFVVESDWFDNEDASRVIATGDYDSDGDVDIFIKNADYQGTHYWYENRQKHVTSTDYTVVSSTIDATDDDIYSATLTATVNDYATYTMAQIPLSYGGTDFDYAEAGDEDGNGVNIWATTIENEFNTIVENSSDVTNLISASNYANFDLALISVEYYDDEEEEAYTLEETHYLKSGLISSGAEFDVLIQDDDEYVSGGVVLYQADVFTYDSETGEYTYNAPTGVTPVNTWESGAPRIDYSSLADDIEFYLYNGGESSGEEESEWDVVDFDDLTVEDDINSILVGGDMTLVVGDDGMLLVDGESWVDYGTLLPALTGVNLNDHSFEDGGGGGYLIVGDSGYIYDVSGGEPQQLCHVTGTPTFNYNFNAISAAGDDFWAVGDNGQIVRIDYTDSENVVCYDESVSGLTDNLNDVFAFESEEGEGSIMVLVVGDNGTVLSYEDEAFVDYTSTFALLENLNALYLEEGGVIVGDNGFIATFEDEGPEVVTTDITANLYDCWFTTDGDDVIVVVVVGADGAYYYSQDGSLEVWESSYTGTVGDLYSLVVSEEEGAVYVGGINGFMAETGTDGSSGSEEINEEEWDLVTSGEAYEFSSGVSDLKWRAVVSTESEYLAPLLNSVSISYSTTEPEVLESVTPPQPPFAPTAERPDILSSTSIQWNFADTADNESSFKFYDESNTLISEIVEADLEYVVETGLTANTSYQRYISAYNSDGESSLTDLGSVYTLANVPSISSASVVDETSISLSINHNDNSVETEYAIYEEGTMSWLNESGDLGEVRSFQSESEWLNGEAGILITGLTENAMYSFRIMAKNGDGVLTELSDQENIIVHKPVEASLILSKKVGVNVESEVVGVYFGRPVFAGTDTAEKLRTIPLMANLANIYIAFTCFLMVLCLLLVILNAAPCCRTVKHAHKMIFTDWRGKKADEFYHTLHGEDAVRHGKVYNNHKNFYKFTNWGVLGVFMGLVVKVGVVLVTAIIVYGGFQVNAFENQSGDSVHVGDELTYQIEYINNGDEVASNVVITDTLPAEVTYLSESLVNGEECEYAEGVITCEYEELDGGEEGVIEFKTLVSGAVGETAINISTGTFTEGEDIVSSNSVTNEITTDEEPVDCEAGETCEVELTDGWNFFRMTVGAKTSFAHLDGNHAVQLTSANTVTNKVGLRITSDPIDVELDEGGEATVDSDGNGLDDMTVKAQGIESDDEAVVGIMAIEEVPAAPVCGDLTCNGDEACETCPGDCGECPVPDFCGNDVCGETESCSTCASDCGECPVPEFCGNFVCGVGETCDNCASDCGACASPEEDSDPVAPTNGGGGGSVVKNCEDGIDNDGDGLIDLSDPGCESSMDNDEYNEIVTEKESWEKTEEELEEEQAEEVEEILESETTEKITTTIATIVSGVTQEDFEEVKKDVVEATKNVVVATKKVASATINNPVVEKVNDVAKEPVVVASTVSSVAAVATVGATGATGASILTYLQFLFTQPLMLITRRKKRGWGVVYNSITKKSVDLSIVRLYEADTKKLIQTRVTDKMGRYQFIVKPGKYFLEVSKKEYKYPSELLERAEIDGEYQGVYYGDPITVGEDGIINNPIPLDPNKKMETGKQIMRKFGWKRLQSLFTLLGPILAVISFIITPEMWIGSLIAVQLVIYFIFRRLADSEEPVSWGKVKDSLTGKSLKRSIVRVFDTKYNKLLDTQVTEKRGKYAFLVGNNEYYITTEKEGYQPHRTDAYDMSHEKSGYLAKDIGMTKEGSSGSGKDGDEAVAVKSDLGRQSEKEEGGVKKVVRNRDEKFTGEIKDVDLDELHEDFYDVDSLRKN